MKNVLLCLALLFASAGAIAQSEADKNPAREAAEVLAQRYQLDAKQKAEMVKIQERKYRNLGEIEPLKKTDPQKFMQKIRSLQQANEKSYERVLRKEQLQLFRQEQLALREKKALVSKEMKSAGASQQEINQKMTELDLEAMQ